MASGIEHLQAEAVEADVGAAVGQGLLVGVVVAAVAVADDQAGGRQPLTRGDIDLVVPAGAVLGVGDQRHACRLGRLGRGGENLALIVRHLALAGGDLDHAAMDAGGGDAVLDLPLEALGDLVHRHLVEGVGDPHRLDVGAGGADQAHAALLRDFGDELDVAAQVHRARVDHRPNPVGMQLLEGVDRPLDGFGALEGRHAGVHEPAGEADHHVLMDQRATQIAGLHLALDGIHLSGHECLSLRLAGPRASRPGARGFSEFIPAASSLPPSLPCYFPRSSTRWILPVSVFGSSSSTSIRRGTL